MASLIGDGAIDSKVGGGRQRGRDGMARFTELIVGGGKWMAGQAIGRYCAALGGVSWLGMA